MRARSPTSPRACRSRSAILMPPLPRPPMWSRERIFIHRGGPFFMECRGLVASYDAIADAYTVYISSQGSHRIKRGLLDVLDLNDNQMHVMTPDVGGGFGPKGAIYPEYPCVAACARAHRPAGEMDRGPAREFSLHPPGARPILGPRTRGRRGCRAFSGCAAAWSTTPAPSCRGAWCCPGSPPPRCPGPM